MKLAGSKKHRLEALGWETVRSKADRPSTIPDGDVLHVGEDLISVDQPDEEIPLFELDEIR